MRKKLITMGLVSALGASTSAWAVDLDPADMDTPSSIASDTILTAETVSATAFAFTGTAIETTTLGVGVSNENQVFVRVDLTGAAFNGAVTSMALTLRNSADTTTVAATVEVAQGGADESEFVIFDLTAGALGVAQTDLVNMTAPVALPFSGTASVAMTVYETLTQAVNEQESLYSISGSFATLTTGVLVTTVAEGAVAEVSEDFLAFSDGAGGTTDTGNFGTIQYAANPVAVEADDTAVVTADSITDADLTITLGGLDMGWGTYFLDADGNCDDVANRTAIALATDELSASVANVVGIDATPHAICAIAGGTEEIPESTLTADLEWTTVATAVAPLADTSDVVGSITRNGTTVQIPYLTTFEDYNQRIVLVNRHSQDADYTITFRGEDGVTWTAGEKATGEIPQGEVLSVRARDVVTITGATRIAATVTVVAPSAVVDVATNQVNLSDGSTDTVVYTP